MMDKTLVKGNDGAQLEASLHDDIFTSAFSGSHVSSAIDKLVVQGKEVPDMILRGYFRDVNHGNALICLYSEAVDSDDDELEKLLLLHCAMYPAIHGDRINILKQAVIGKADEDNKKKGQGLRDLFGFGKKNAGENNGIQ